MYQDLISKKIDITKEEFKDFPPFLNGHIFIEYDNGFVTREPEPVVIIPNSVTKLQAKLQLLEIGLLDEVETLIEQDRKAKLYWTDSQNFLRNDEILLSMATALGLSDAQLDDLFVEASKL